MYLNQPGPAGRPRAPLRAHRQTPRVPASGPEPPPATIPSRSARAALVLLFLLTASPAAAQLPPLTLEEVIHLVVSKVPAARLESISRERCLAFTWTDETAARLRAAEATPADLSVVRSTCKRLPPPTFAGSPTPPRLEIAQLRPRTAVYRLRGRADTIIQRITHGTVNGHNIVRFRTDRIGPGSTAVSETVIDALSFAPVYYTLRAVAGADTSRVMLRLAESRVTGYTQDYRERAYAVRHNAHRGTLLPGMSDLLLLASTELSLGRRFVLPTFVNTTGDPCLLTLAVERETVAIVPAGTFPAWQVRASGSGCGPAFRLYVNRDPIDGYPARVILASEGSGYRVELVRAWVDDASPARSTVIRPRSDRDR